MNKILKAKERRFELKKEISNRDLISISLSLNIVGYPKTNEQISLFFKLISAELILFLKANLISFIEKDILNLFDDAGNFLIISISPILTSKSSIEIKELCERFENSYSFGRILDVDVTDENFSVISSNKLKKCYICNEPALECMRNKKHPIEELQNHISVMMKSFITQKRKEKIIKKISSIAIKSILYEISLSPKPGLVDRFSSGSHTDMDFFTFLNSTSVLSQYFNNFAELGYGYCNKNNFDDVLPKIRVIGLQMENDMFYETNGINTQKGIIFLLGLTIFATSLLISRNEKFSFLRISEIISLVTKNIVNNELKRLSSLKSSKDITHGEICHKEFGDKLGGGIRYEVEHGLPTVINHSLPFIKSFTNKKFIIESDLKEIMLRTLLNIMSNNNDTNILYRNGKDKLDKIKSLSKQALSEQKPISNNSNYSELMKYCKDEKISPGGSADLLVVTIFLYFVESVKIS